MAELILSPIAEKIIGGLASAAVKEIALIWGVKDELDQLEDTISTIRAVLLDAEEKQLHNHQVRNWLQRLGGAVDEADDLIDDFNTEALRRQVMPGGEMAKQVCTFFSASNQVAFRRKMGRRIRRIKKKLDAISNDKNFHLEVRDEASQLLNSRARRETHSFVRQDEVVGREEDRVKIKKLLLDGAHELGENALVIPIVGMGGLGKTTLAQSVFNDEKVQQFFELKIWVCVSDNFDLKFIVQQIIKSATHDNNLGAIDSMDLLQKDLRKLLDGRRYILVLDDLWEECREKWLKLKDLLLSGSQGSRVIVTTRSKMVAQNTGSFQPYQLGVLDEEKSWSLFEKMAFKQKEEQRNSKILDVGRQIVKRCGGVPLAIRAIGSMLYFKASESEWLSFYKGFSEMSQHNEDDILPTLKLSYDHLSSHLKCCFAYCRLFPKDYKIDIQTLVKLWMAQGFLKPQNPRHDECLEDVGYGYFEDLLERSFFQDVEKDDWGTVKRCKMHDLMHDLAIKVAGTECTTLSSSSEGTIDKNTRHVSFDCNTSSPRKISSSLVQACKIRSILLPNQELSQNKWEKPACGAIKSNSKSIRTLDLNDSGIIILSKSIGKCKHLRYLDLSKNRDIKVLPDSITNLLNLQTLKLNSCVNLQELPRDLKKLVNLRHLEIEECYALTHMPCGLSQLTKLQTLPKYILTKSSSSVPRHVGGLNELMSLDNLRGDFVIENLRHGKDAAEEYKLANLKEKQYLRSLKLEWKSGVDIDSIEVSVGYEMSLEVLQPHHNIQELSLRKYGGVKISSWLSALTNLVSLSIALCKKCQQLVPLNQFHSLEILKLEYLPCMEYINGKEDLTSETKIILPSLRKLHLRGLKKLKGWWRGVESGDFAAKTTQSSTPSKEEIQQRRSLPSFPRLSEFCIWNCPELACMPLFPHLEKQLEWSKTSLKTFQETAESSNGIAISATMSSSSLSPLSKLTILRISQMEEDLQCLPDWFKTLTSLKHLRISNCSKLKYLSPGIQHLTSLEELVIRDCEELEEMVMTVNGDDAIITWKSLGRTLQSLSLQGFNKLVALPEGIQHLTGLQQLRIWHWNSLKTIPEWISNLNSLNYLGFWDCPELMSLPQGIQSLACLKSLSIEDCPMLLKRCKRQIGEEWPKIAHIEHLALSPDPNEDNDQNPAEKQKTDLHRTKACSILKNFGL